MIAKKKHTIFALNIVYVKVNMNILSELRQCIRFEFHFNLLCFNQRNIPAKKFKKSKISSCVGENYCRYNALCFKIVGN